MARTRTRATSTQMPRWVREDVLPRMGRRTRAVRLLEQGTVRRSAVIHTDRNTYIAEKGPLMGVRIYDIGALTPVTACPNCDFRFDASYFLVKGPEPTSVAEPLPPPAPTPRPRRRRITGDVNPVADIRDITPALRKQLKAGGFETTHDLLRASPARLQATVDAPAGRIQDWLALADLMRVRSVGPRFAEVLFDLGVSSASAVARQDPAELYQRMKTALGPPRLRRSRINPSTVRRWVRNAKRLERSPRRFSR